MKLSLPLEQPTGGAVSAMRLRLELTQAQAAELVYITRARWADYERGVTPIDLGRWHLFLLRNGLVKAGA